MLMALGEDPDREGLRDTPRRVIKAWSELTAGNKMALNLTTFTNEGFTGMVAVGPVEFYSTCEHHLLPFFGSAWVAYIPGDKLLGLSKLPRVVEMFSRRLQNQERLTKQVGDCLKDVLGIEDVGVLFKGRHMCMMARGVKQSDALMTTPYLSGKFLSDPAVRAEFYALSHKD